MKKIPWWVHILIGIAIGVMISCCTVAIINKPNSKNASSGGTSSVITSSVNDTSSTQQNTSSAPSDVSSNTSSQTADNTVKQWEAEKTYNSGDIVTYQGKKYKAKWWTLGEAPKVTTDGVWEEVN